MTENIDTNTGAIIQGAASIPDAGKEILKESTECIKSWYHLRVLRGKRPLYALNLPSPKGLCGLENERNATTKESSSSS